MIREYLNFHNLFNVAAATLPCQIHSMTTADLDDLLSRVALKDRSAFARLYERTSAKLFGVCLRILKNRSEAEEALQDVYVKVWQKAGQFSGQKARPMTWLISIARNQSIDMLRARKLQTSELSEAKEIEDPSHSPETAALLSGEGARIALCMDELDSQHATAVRRAYVEGMSYQELADDLKTPLNTVRTWLRRSLMKLKECLER